MTDEYLHIARDRYDELVQDVADARAERQIAEDARDTWRHDHDLMRGELAGLRETIAEQESIINELHASREELQRSAARREQFVRDLKTERDQLRVVAETLGEENAQQHVQIAEMEEELNRVAGEYNSIALRERGER